MRNLCTDKMKNTIIAINAIPIAGQLGGTQCKNKVAVDGIKSILKKGYVPYCVKTF